MRRLALVLMALAGILSSGAVHADHNGPWLPGDPAESPVQHRAMERGYVNVCFDKTSYAYPSFRAQATETRDFAIAKGAPYSQEVAWDGTDGRGLCDVRNVMVDDTTFVSACGAGAAACIYYWLDPVVIYYRRALGYTYWNSALCHEGGSGSTGHLWWLHEQYNDVAFVSDHKTWTCMDFGVIAPGDPLGRYVWALPDWDRDRILNAVVPDVPSFVGFSVGNDWAQVSWSQSRKDGGKAHANNILRNSSATRVAFGHSDCDGCPITWAGTACGERWNWCYTDYGDGARSFDPYWRGCLYLRAENALSWWVPQVSAPDYWTKAGCW